MFRGVVGQSPSFDTSGNGNCNLASQRSKRPIRDKNDKAAFFPPGRHVAKSCVHRSGYTVFRRYSGAPGKHQICPPEYGSYARRDGNTRCRFRQPHKVALRVGIGQIWRIGQTWFSSASRCIILIVAQKYSFRLYYEVIVCLMNPFYSMIVSAVS